MSADFLELYEALDSTTKTNAKVDALKTYLADVSGTEGAWAIYFLTGRKVKRPISSTKLREWAAELVDLPGWLFEDCYHEVGDLSETIALTLRPRDSRAARLPMALDKWVEEEVLGLLSLSEEQKRLKIEAQWQKLNRSQIYLYSKLLYGGFRVGVSKTLVIRAASEAFGIERATAAHRLAGQWQPTAEFWSVLTAPEGSEVAITTPYPFCLAYALDKEPELIGKPTDFQVEWKWDGIRAQLIRRAGECFLWSRGDELISAAFPEIVEFGQQYLEDGTVLDGELVSWDQKTGRPAPFSTLQKRLGRRQVSQAMRQKNTVSFIAYDQLEAVGQDVRSKTTIERRSLLEKTVSSCPERLRLSPPIVAATWAELLDLRGESRQRGVEGFMLKHLEAPYGTGRKKGQWWKWKVEPYTIDCVLLYAQAGHGRRASLLTDYTFAVWTEARELVPVAKAYSGLDQKEIGKLDYWIKRNTLEKWGPVRSVPPTHVFEIAFESIAKSGRHKSGVALRFPRISRWRHDKQPADADTLEQVKDLLKVHLSG